MHKILKIKNGNPKLLSFCYLNTWKFLFVLYTLPFIFTDILQIRKISVGFRTYSYRSLAHRITERSRLEGSSGRHLLQTLCSSRTTRSWLPRTTSRRSQQIQIRSKNVKHKPHPIVPVTVTCSNKNLFPKVHLTIKSNARPFQKHFPPRRIWNKLIATPAPHFQTDLVPDFRISSKNKKKSKTFNSKLSCKIYLLCIRATNAFNLV